MKPNTVRLEMEEAEDAVAYPGRLLPSQLSGQVRPNKPLTKVLISLAEKADMQRARTVRLRIPGRHAATPAIARIAKAKPARGPTAIAGFATS